MNTRGIKPDADLLQACSRLSHYLEQVTMPGDKIYQTAKKWSISHPNSTIAQVPIDIPLSYWIERCSYDQIQDLEQIFNYTWPRNTEYINWLLCQGQIEQFVLHVDQGTLMDENSLARLCRHYFSILIKYSRPLHLSGNKCMIKALKYRQLDECQILAQMGYFHQPISSHIIGEIFHIILKRQDLTLLEKTKFCHFLITHNHPTADGFFQAVVTQELNTSYHLLSWAKQYNFSSIGWEYICSFSVHGTKLFDMLYNLGLVPINQYCEVLLANRTQDEKKSAMQWFQWYWQNKNIVPLEQIQSLVHRLKASAIEIMLSCDVSLPENIFELILSRDTTDDQREGISQHDYWPICTLLYNYGYIRPAMYSVDQFGHLFFIYRWLMKQKDFQAHHKHKRNSQWQEKQRKQQRLISGQEPNFATRIKGHCRNGHSCSSNCHKYHGPVQDTYKMRLCRFDHKCRSTASKCYYLHSKPQIELPDELAVESCTLDENRAQELSTWFIKYPWWGRTITQTNEGYDCTVACCAQCAERHVKFMFRAGSELRYYCSWQHIPESERVEILYCQLN